MLHSPLICAHIWSDYTSFNCVRPNCLIPESLLNIMDRFYFCIAQLYTKFNTIGKIFCHFLNTKIWRCSFTLPVSSAVCQRLTVSAGRKYFKHMHYDCLHSYSNPCLPSFICFHIKKIWSDIFLTDLVLLVLIFYKMKWSFSFIILNLLNKQTLWHSNIYQKVAF